MTPETRGRRLGFVFPGQGSQAVGMGREWALAFATARDTFEEADERLGLPLSRLCWEGPEADLQLTENTQPAILTTSVAILRVVTEAGLEPSVVAGHSLGEYSALVATGVLAFGDALDLVRRRGAFMQQAVPVGQGAMAAILGLEADVVAAVAAEAAGNQVCSVANYNAPEQTVVAGDREAVERAIELARQRGARRAVALAVSAPFHCALMAPARQALTPWLRAAVFADPQVPVITNIDALPAADGAAARDALERQVDGPVRWVASVRRMVRAEGAERLVEIGPGAVLTGLSKRIERDVEARSLAAPESLDKLLQEET